MAYATAVMMHYNTGAKKLTLKARGRAISTAVDVAEVVNNRFFQGGLSKHVNLGTEIVGDGQDARNVSTIEIILERLKYKFLWETHLGHKPPFSNIDSRSLTGPTGIGGLSGSAFTECFLS